MRVKTETMIQKDDGTKIFEPRTIQEVFNDIKKILIEERLCPEEYFSLNYQIRGLANEPFPEISDLFCNAQWGESEGIYLDITVYWRLYLSSAYGKWKCPCQIYSFA